MRLTIIRYADDYERALSYHHPPDHQCLLQDDAQTVDTTCIVRSASDGIMLGADINEDQVWPGWFAKCGKIIFI